MSAPASGSRLWLRVVLWGLAYSVIGVVTAALSRGAPSGEMKQIWRLAAWALSLGVFAASFGDERSRSGGAPPATALRAALPVALGGFLLAVWATVHSMSTGAGRLAAHVIALVAWPAMLGVASFLVGWAAAAVLARKKTG
ncbi:MAG: hypothetical protein ABSG61_13115 [Gemmatimonadales bacterium]